MRKIWPTPGGVHPPDNKLQSLHNPLADCPIPGELIFPLAQHLGIPADPCVAVGDRVLTGQVIATAHGPVSANIHASSSGVVSAIEDRPIAHPSGMSDRCIVITTDGKDEWVELESCEDYKNLDKETLLQKIRAAGIVGMGGAGFPSDIKLGPKDPIDTLIINGTECEPYITADDILMQTQADEIMLGVELLHHLLGEPVNVLIGIEANKPEAIAAMEAAADHVSLENADHIHIDVVPLPEKYPSGGEKQLVQMLTGREVPSGGLPAQQGVVCQNIATVLAAYRAVALGEPLISRITTVTGNAFEKLGNIRVRLGTPMDFILRQYGYDAAKASRLIMGGPMMGFSVLNSAAPVIKTTNCLLAPDHREAPPLPPAQACIRCGLCAEACPASLLPQQLYWYSRAEDYAKLEAYNIKDCIECGACSYVCPSHIPLVQYYRAAKGTMRQQAQDKQQSDRARERFEFHKARIEAEKAARAKAREEAAQKAKQRQLEKAAAGETEPAKKAPPPKKAPVDPAAEREKLERRLSGATDRLAKQQEKLDEVADDPAKADVIRAKMKEIELKCQQYRDQLAKLGEGQ